MSYTDQSDDDDLLQIQRAYGQWLNAKLFTQCVHNVHLDMKCRCVLLGDEKFCFVFIFLLAKLSKTDNIVSKITQYELLTYWTVEAIRSVGYHICTRVVLHLAYCSSDIA